MKRNLFVHTPSAAREWFRANGINVSQWAKANGFSTQQVYAVLSGRARGERGASHRIAVALGIKADPISGDFTALVLASNEVAAQAPQDAAA